jgi:acetylornithine deacetylase
MTPSASTAPTLGTAKELLARLVAFDTTSVKTNIPLIAFVEAYLAEHGVRSRRVPTPDGLKSSLFATIGPADAGGIALSGHTDVVPVASQNWDTDPFQMVERDGKLYGRGTCDMKGYLACCLAMVPALTARKLKVPFHLAFSYDEEVGCTGVRPMIGEFGKTLPVPRMVFVGEPSNMTVVDAHKGPVRWRVEVTGRAAHSSMPHYGVNAIAYAARLIGEILAMEDELKAGPRNPRFDPPWTTTQVTQIEGGTASNVVPVPCWFGWETRALPGFDPMTLQRRLEKFATERCLPGMRKLAPESEIVIRTMNRVSAYAADNRSGIVPLTLKMAGQNETLAVSYCTEAGLFQDGGAPAIICGPGDIAQAHTANEFVRIEELAKCLTFLGRLADWAEA